jgi:hypothetical protein
MKHNITTIDRPESPIYPKPPIVHSIEIINIHDALSFSKFEDDYQTRCIHDADNFSQTIENPLRKSRVRERAVLLAMAARARYISTKTKVSAMIAKQGDAK